LDVASVSSSPTQLYEVLDKLYQTEYKIDDRLVFYSSFDISDDLLKHFYAAVNLIDISNFFILICSPHDIEQRLQELCKKFSTDQVPFQYQMVKLTTTKTISNTFTIPTTLCTEPWTHLEIDNNGRIKPCCVSQQIVGHISKDNIKEVFFDNQMATLRQQLLSGSQPAGCKKCWELESVGLVSNRLKHLSLNQKNLLSRWIDKPTLKSLDLKPGVVCNFKCRICGPVASSMHIQEQVREKKVPINLPMDWIDTQYQQITDIIDDIDNIDIYGGEPFLMKNLTKLVEDIVSKGRAEHIRLHYNSNGSVNPDFLIPYWKHFKHIDLHFSIDNVGKRFELERGGSWIGIEKNIKNLLQLKLPNLKISIMPTINIMNVLYLDDIIRWADSLELNVNFNFLSEPKYLSISMLTDQAKQLIFTKYYDNRSPMIKGVVESIKKCKGSDGLAFVKSMKDFDRMRKEKFFDTHHEISKAMGYHGR